MPRSSQTTHHGAIALVIRVSEEQLADYLRAAEPAPAQPPVARARLKHLRLS
jgi:hypothetical protein